MNVSHRLGQKNRGLAGRVRSAYHYDFIALAELRFHESRVVVDTRTFELTEIRKRWPVVSSAGGNDHCASRNGHAVVDLLIAGILQYRFAAADHDRYLRRLHAKAIEQLPHIGVPVKIEILEGVAIAS